MIVFLAEPVIVPITEKQETALESSALQILENRCPVQKEPTTLSDPMLKCQVRNKR